MKKQILTIIFFIVNYSNYNAQNFKEIVSKDFMEYTNVIKNEDFSKIPDYVFPEIFNDYSKDDLIKTMSNLYEKNDSINIAFTKSRIHDVSDLIVEKNEFFSILTYSNILNFKVNFSLHPEIDEIDAMIESLENAYGIGNAYYDKEQNVYRVLVFEKIIAKSRNGKTNWKFATFKGSSPLVLKLIPKKIIDLIFN